MTAIDELQRRAASGDVRAQVAYAARLDEDGKHVESIEWLARAAQTGDAEALTRVGVRLVTGRNAPSLPAQGAGLLQDAVKAGGGEAAAMLAVLAGGGFFQRQDWDQALGHLQRAAELSFTLAQDQLRLLGGGSARSADADWRRLRDQVDVRAWIDPGDTAVFNDAPQILIVERMLAPEVCDWLIDQSRDRLVRAEVHDPRTGRTVMGETRTNRIANFGLTETNLVNLLIQARIGSTVKVAQTQMEAFAILNYAPGEQASDHYDYLDPSVPAYAAEIAQLGQRQTTCLVYLNDDYEGGETDFPQLGKSWRGRKGDALMFWSVDAAGKPDPRSVHAGRPPTAGQKWVFSQFIRDRPGIRPGDTA